MLVLALPIVRPASSTTRGQNDQSLKHCTSEVMPNSTRVEDFRCFRTFAEAISAATHGRVKLARSVQPKDVTQEMLDQGLERARRGPTPLQGTVIGIEYRDTRFGGNSWTVEAGDARGCRDGLSYGYTSLPSNWDDVISSARVFGGCNVAIHFQNRNYNQNSDGSRVDCTCPTMGIMNDRTSSINWRP